MDEEIISAYEKSMQELLNKFKSEMKKIAENVLGEVYVDAHLYADGDAHINYYNYLRNEFRKRIIKDVLEEDYGLDSWAGGIRKTLVEKHMDEMTAKHIDSLNKRIQRQEELYYTLRGY